MILQIILLVIGFVILVAAADFFVGGVSDIAKNLGVPTVLIGLTIVAFGTSAPEFFISTNAIINGNSEVAMSHVLGTSTFNILFIIGVCSLIKPIYIKNNTVKKEMPILVLISILLPILFLDNVFDKNAINQISRNDGIVILLFFLVFVYYLAGVIKSSRVKYEKDKPKYSIKRSIVTSIIGLIAIIIGGDIIVDNAIYIAESLRVTERIISLTIIAFGTSLPEFITGIIAVKKNEQDIVIGNIVGTNIFNIGVVTGLPVALFGAIVPTDYNIFDLIMVIISAIILFLFSHNDKKITKKEGIIMLIIFFAYYAYILI